jgi:hypothetical protein
MYRSSEVGGPPVSLHVTVKRWPCVALNITPEYQQATADVPPSENEEAGYVWAETEDEAKLTRTAKISTYAIREFLSRMIIYSRRLRFKSLILAASLIH